MFKFNLKFNLKLKHRCYHMNKFLPGILWKIGKVKYFILAALQKSDYVAKWWETNLGDTGSYDWASNGLKIEK